MSNVSRLRYRVSIEPTPSQAAICERFNSIADTPLSTERVGIALHTLQLDPLHAMRIPRDGVVCGWYIWGGDFSEDPDFFQSLCVHHLDEYVGTLLPYLALPAGWRVLLAPGYEDVWFDSALNHAGG
jgi:hypothetical protein